MSNRSGSVAKSHRYLISILVFALIAIFFGAIFTIESSAKDDALKELETFTDVMSLIENNYVTEVDDHQLIEGAINGMLRSLDPYSAYLTPEMFKEMQVETKGKFGGLGIEISINNGWLTVITPLEGTPAWRAGLKPGDRIIKIDGEPTHSLSLMESVFRMRGEKGKPVTIMVFRDGFDEPRDFTIIRDTIHIAAVKSEITPDRIGYVKLRSFSQRASRDVKATLKNMIKRKVRGVVLDLRNNPGGLLDQAVEVAELFLERGALIVYTQGRLPEQNQKFLASSGAIAKEAPLVVLVNNGSASASEIVSGALKDLKRAVLVGAKTFGKGSVQVIMPLKEGAGLKLTTARYYTPSGVEIEGKGIAPNIEVENKELEPVVTTPRKSEKDLFTEKRDANGNREDAESVKFTKRPLIDLENDAQLARAFAIIRDWSDIDTILQRAAALGSPEKSAELSATGERVGATQSGALGSGRSK